MRTLVVSDLHLGATRAGLTDPDWEDPLLEALHEVDRLVLLGDLVELREGPLRDALAAASRVLRELGGALGPAREVIVVPGNHDHHLLSGWAARRAATAPPPALGLESAVDWVDGEPLAVVADALAAGGARVRVAYPGVWLREDVYATHGHYLDRHTTVPILERLGAGAMARLLRRPSAAARSAEDYEAVLVPLYAWMHAMAQSRRVDGSGGSAGTAAPGASARLWAALDRGARNGGLRAHGARLGVAALVTALNRAGLGPLHADVTAGALRRAGLAAIGAVACSLSVDADWVLFGHTHRAGPLPPDEPGEWRTPAGARLLNTGCWVHEPAFLGPRPAESPYRAGFAVRIDDGGPPELLNLLA